MGRDAHSRIPLHFVLRAMLATLSKPSGAMQVRLPPFVAVTNRCILAKKVKRPDPTTASQRLIWLLGQPYLADYLSFVETRVVGGDLLDRRTLTDEWRAANDVYYDLESTEAGIADSIKSKVAGKKLASRIARLEANPWFRHSFDALPYTFERVELDKLIVSQSHVEATYLDAVKQQLGEHPDDLALFDFCLPLTRPMPPVRVQRLSGDRYLFASPSTDFRSNTPQLLRGDAIANLDHGGPTAALFGVAVGFGCNVMSCVRSDKRLLLQNGYHRAFALRSAGFTHGWFVVETVTRKDELRLTGAEDAIDNPEFYFAAKRPPILRDFFDKRLAKALHVRPMESQIEVEIKVRSVTATQH